MHKKFLALFAFTSVAILFAVVAVAKLSVSVEVASLAAMATFAAGAGLLLWWNSKHHVTTSIEKSKKTNGALIWLLVPFAASAFVAAIEALHEGWDIGDTIGAGFFAVFAILSVYETLRRRRRKDSKVPMLPK